LISSGVTDKYFQLARCFRDEGGRKDRQPEFTQIDLEMGFVSGGTTEAERAAGWRIGGGQVRRVVEGLIARIWKDIEGVDVLGSAGEFPVMRYHEAMSRFGSDKPDTRFGLEVGHRRCLPARTRRLADLRPLHRLKTLENTSQPSSSSRCKRLKRLSTCFSSLPHGHLSRFFPRMSFRQE
jgi:aspartyl-tRNA synthetase